MTSTDTVRHREKYTTAITIGLLRTSGKVLLIFNNDEMLVKIYKIPFLIHITRIMTSTFRVNFGRKSWKRKTLKRIECLSCVDRTNRQTDKWRSTYSAGGGLCVWPVKRAFRHALYQLTKSNFPPNFSSHRDAVGSRFFRFRLTQFGSYFPDHFSIPRFLVSLLFRVTP